MGSSRSAMPKSVPGPVNAVPGDSRHFMVLSCALRSVTSMAGHFPGDIAAGALLGDVIGDYFLITHEKVDPATLRD